MTFSAQVSIPYFTNIPSDVITNTFHFAWVGLLDPPDDDDFLALAVNLELFYESIFAVPGGASMAIWTDPTNTRIKIYDLEDPKPRVPVFDDIQPLTVNKTADTVLPPEVAVVLSYRGAGISGVPAASQRGRLYIGGLGNNCADPGTSGSFAEPEVDFVSGLLSAAEQLVTNSTADNWAWVVHSRKLDQDFLVTRGWVDDAFDTQRRRGNAATSRRLWP